MILSSRERVNDLYLGHIPAESQLLPLFGDQKNQHEQHKLHRELHKSHLVQQRSGGVYALFRDAFLTQDQHTWAMFRRALSLVLALLLTGCASTNLDSPYSAADTNFAEMMIPHHEQAIVMADLALTHTTNPEVLALANQIKSAQGPEIEQMKKWGNVDSDMHMGHMMAGMLDDDELADLDKAKEKEFDKLFLNGMIKHHEGAIMMAQMVIDSKNAEVSALARSIVTTQQAEIERMRAILGS